MPRAFPTAWPWTPASCCAPWPAPTRPAAFWHTTIPPAGHSVRGGPPDDIPYYGGHRPARLYDHGSYHHSGGGWLFDAEPRQPAGIPRKQRRAAGCQPLNAAHAPCRVPAGRIFLWFGYKISANLFTLKICRAIIIIQLIVVHERNDYGRSLSLKGTVSAHRRPAAGDRSADAGHP